MPTSSSSASPSASGVSSSTCWPLTIARIVSRSGPWKPSASATAPGVSPGAKSRESRSCRDAARFARIGISLTSTIAADLLRRGCSCEIGTPNVAPGGAKGARRTRYGIPQLPTHEMRLAALQKGAYAFAVVLGGEHAGQGLRVVVHVGAGVAGESLVEQPLDLLDRQRGAARHLLGQFVGAAMQRSVRYDLVHQADAQRLRRVDHRAGIEQLRRAGEADHARQQPGAGARVWHKAALGED